MCTKKLTQESWAQIGFSLWKVPTLGETAMMVYASRGVDGRYHNQRVFFHGMDKAKVDELNACRSVRE